MESLGFFLSFAFGFVQLGLLLFVIIAVAGARAEEDPDGERPAAIYYNGVLFVTVFAVLFAAFTIVTSLLNLTIDKPSDDFFGGSNHDGDWDGAVRALIVGLVAAGLYRVHDQRRQLRSWSVPGRRIRRTHLYSVSFVATIVATVAAVLALWSLWEIIAPGVTDAGPRSEGWISFISAAFLAVSSSALAWLHLREAEPDAPLRATPTAPIIPPEPVAPPPVDMETGPRKAAPKRAAPARKAVKKAAKRP